METVAAAVQYGDFRGESAADVAEKEGLEHFARSRGIKGMPVAFSFFSDDNGHFQFQIFTVEGCGSVEEVEARAKANDDGSLEVTSHNVADATVGDMLKLFKRFKVAMRGRFPSVKEMRYET